MGCAWGEDDINLERNQFGRKSGEPLGLPLGISVFDHDVAALDVTEVTQPLEERLSQVGTSGQVERQPAYSSDLGRLLGLGGERGGHEAASQRADELPPRGHWMTSSARSRSDCGIVSPSAFAVLRLITSSNFVGCPMGRSAGFVPLRILST
ncbi:MAG: merR-type protein [Anaerolineales bacterium]|nr:merR-type protein [Anaerolineales bacterium]